MRKKYYVWNWLEKHSSLGLANSVEFLIIVMLLKHIFHPLQNKKVPSPFELSGQAHFFYCLPHLQKLPLKAEKWIAEFISSFYNQPSEVV